MGEFFRFGGVELGAAGFADNLRKRFMYLLRRKGDGQILEFIVIKGQNHKLEIVQPGPPGLVEIRLSEHFSQFNFPLAPAAAEDHRISVLYAAYGGACFIHTHKGLHVVIAFASGIGGPDCLGQLNAAPALLFHHSRILLTKW